MLSLKNVSFWHLPEIDIRGNTHFPFSDLNNLEIADLMCKFLENKVLISRQAEQRISITRSGSRPSSQGSAETADRKEQVSNEQYQGNK